MVDPRLLAGWPWVDTDEAMDDISFIVNDWTGPIKALDGNRFVRCVSGDTYGINDVADNGDGTVTDDATGQSWAQDDSCEAMNWWDALACAELSTLGGYDDWRLPNAKELQSIADYSGILPAIDPVFTATRITNEAGNADYPYYWSSTTNPYIDPNDEDGADGPEGERYDNDVRLVRGGDVAETPPDFTTAAATLGVTEEALTAALGVGGGGAPSEDQGPPSDQEESTAP